MSWDGSAIYEVILGNPQAQNHIIVQTAMHGREYITMLVAMRQLEYYASNWYTESYAGIPYA